MSALGHKRTFAVQNGMSALAPKADMCGALTHVRFGPIADISSDGQMGASMHRPPWRASTSLCNKAARRPDDTTLGDRH